MIYTPTATDTLRSIARDLTLQEGLWQAIAEQNGIWLDVDNLGNFTPFPPDQPIAAYVKTITIPDNWLKQVTAQSGPVQVMPDKADTYWLIAGTLLALLMILRN